MPLKHHTETALMLMLGVLIAVTGFVLGLLPAFPGSILYWCVLFAITVLYPLVLSSFFRANRADYEFRLLHWVPAGMAVLWLLLELLSYRFEAAHAAQLGFFTLWSLPLVALGIVLAIMFSAHVIRRRTVRIGFLAVLLAAFAASAYAASVTGFNARLTAVLFPQNDITRVASGGYHAVAGLVGSLRFPGMASEGSSVSSDTLASASSTSSSAAVPASSMSSYSSLTSSRPVVASASLTSAAMTSDAHDTIAKIATGSIKTPPKRLTKTGPEETLGMLIATLMACYCLTLHVRARRRMGVEWAA